MAAREDCSVRTTVRHLLRLGILAGAGYALFRVLSTRSASTTAWEAQPFPFPPQPAVDATSPWVEAAASGACPAHHPVKAKLSSGIFHVPGGANYTRTHADRCYRSADAAEADGLRPSKR
jgi:hypothetical protein